MVVMMMKMVEALTLVIFGGDGDDHGDIIM